MSVKLCFWFRGNSWWVWDAGKLCHAWIIKWTEVCIYCTVLECWRLLCEPSPHLPYYVYVGQCVFSCVLVTCHHNRKQIKPAKVTKNYHKSISNTTQNLLYIKPFCEILKSFLALYSFDLYLLLWSSTNKLCFCQECVMWCSDTWKSTTG